jgi:hypothetical protein
MPKACRVGCGAEDEARAAFALCVCMPPSLRQTRARTAKSWLQPDTSAACRLMSAALTGRGRGGGTSSAARPRDTADASGRTSASAAQLQQAEALQTPLRQHDGAKGLQQSKSSLLQPNSFSTVISAASGEAIHVAHAAAAHPSSPRAPTTRGRGGRRKTSSRSAMLDGCTPPPFVIDPLLCARCVLFSHANTGCSATCIQTARFDEADASQMFIFMAPSLAWMPALVALDHPDDDHVHVVCTVEDGTAKAASVRSTYRVPRSLVFRHDGTRLKLHAGEEAQMLMSDISGYECDVWAKVVIKKVWDESFATVTICSQFRDVIAEKVMPAVLPDAAYE